MKKLIVIARFYCILICRFYLLNFLLRDEDYKKNMRATRRKEMGTTRKKKIRATRRKKIKATEEKK